MRRLLHLAGRHPWVLTILLLVVGLVTFYPIENWRGRRAYEQARQEAETRGVKLDFSNRPVPAIPAESNVYAHPFMVSYFIKGTPTVNLRHPAHLGLNGQPFLMADLKSLPRALGATKSLLELLGDQGSQNMPAGLIEFKNTPLSDIISQLAESAGINLSMEIGRPPFVGSLRPGGKPVTLTIQVKNATAISVLDSLLTEHQLEPVIKEPGSVIELRPAKGSLQEVADWFEEQADEVRQLEEALHRPIIHLNNTGNNVIFWSMPNFVSIGHAAKALASRVKVQLLLGKPDVALRELRMLRRLVDVSVATSPPTLIESLIQTAVAGLLANTLEETLSEGLWGGADLVAIHELLQGLNLFKSHLAALQERELFQLLAEMEEFRNDPVRFSQYFGARAGLLNSISQAVTTAPATSVSEFLTYVRDEVLDESFMADLVLKSGPRGWLDQNLARILRANQFAGSGWEAMPARVDLSKAGQAGNDYVAVIGEVVTPYNAVARLALPNFQRAGITVARNQSLIRLAEAACALERFRMAHQTYPASLNELVPGFLGAVPLDPMTGQPVRYRRESDGDYRLYSLGWDAKDDGGSAASRDIMNGSYADWVWQSNRLLPKR